MYGCISFGRCGIDSAPHSVWSVTVMRVFIFFSSKLATGFAFAKTCVNVATFLRINAYAKYWYVQHNVNMDFIFVSILFIFIDAIYAVSRYGNLQPYMYVFISCRCFDLHCFCMMIHFTVTVTYIIKLLVKCHLLLLLLFIWAWHITKIQYLLTY